jgi:hypothetical protein
MQRIKLKQLVHWQYQYLDTVLKFFTGTKKNYKNWIGNKETTNHTWTASPKGRFRPLLFSQKPGRKGLDAVTSSLCSRNYKPGGIYRQEGRPTNTDCQKTPTQHQLSNVADS